MQEHVGHEPERQGGRAPRVTASPDGDGDQPEMSSSNSGGGVVAGAGLHEEDREVDAISVKVT